MTAEKKYTNEEIKDLLEKAFSGDRDSATALLRSYTNEMYYVAKLYMEDTEDAKKAVQKAFVTAYKRLREVTNAEDLTDWLEDITRTTAVRSLTPFKEEKCVKEYTSEDEAAETDVKLPEDIGVCKKYVLAALNVLSPSERTAAALRWYDHMSIADTASLMQTDAATVKVWLTNAKDCFEEAGMAFGRFAALVNGIHPALIAEEVDEEDDGLIPTRSLKLKEIAAAAAAAEAAKAEAERLAAEAAEKAAQLEMEDKLAAETAEEPAEEEAPVLPEEPAFPEEPELPEEPEEPAFPEEPETPVFDEEPEEPVFPEEPDFPEEPEPVEEHTKYNDVMLADDDLDLSSVPSADSVQHTGGETVVVSNLREVPEDHTIWDETAEAPIDEILKAEEKMEKPAKKKVEIFDEEEEEEELSPRELKKRRKAEEARRKEEEARKKAAMYDDDDDDYDDDDDEESHPILMTILVLLIVLALLAGGIAFLYTKDRVLFNKLPFSEKIVEIAKKITGKDTSEPSGSASISSEISADSASSEGSAGQEEAPVSNVLGTAEVVIDELHVRSKAGTDGEQVDNVYAGDVFDVYEIASDDTYDWYRIGEDRWIADADGDYLTYTPAN